jgi:hypothetical protein
VRFGRTRGSRWGEVSRVGDPRYGQVGDRSEWFVGVHRQAAGVPVAGYDEESGLARIDLFHRLPHFVVLGGEGDVHLLQMYQVADGVTDAQVQAEHDTIMSGGTPTSDPAGLNSPPTPGTGSDAVSPGHYSLLSYNLPKGTYLLQCFVCRGRHGHSACVHGHAPDCPHRLSHAAHGGRLGAPVHRLLMAE